MIQALHQSSYKKMPWKNKKGVTSEIFIFPPEASLEKMDFHFRLSSAPVPEDMTFSKFAGFKRILLPIRGKGFSLNGALYELHEVAYFNGEDETHCELVQGEILDLGLIYKPEVVTADAKVLQFKGRFVMNADPHFEYLVYVLRGNLTLNENAAPENDSLYLKNEAELIFESSKNCVMVLFSVSKK